MMFAQCEDLEAHAEVIVFPRLFVTVEQWIKQYDIYFIKGAVDITSPNSCKIKAQEFIPLELIFDQSKLIKQLRLELPPEIQDQALAHIKEKLMLPNGTTSMSIAFHDRGKRLVLESTKKIVCSLQALQDLEALGVKIALTLNS